VELLFVVVVIILLLEKIFSPSFFDLLPLLVVLVTVIRAMVIRDMVKRPHKRKLIGLFSFFVTLLFSNLLQFSAFLYFQTCRRHLIL
jgi:uncharacterized membrane protein